MRKVRWGVLSTANIGIKKVIPAMMKSEFCEMVAISSRNIDQANEAKQLLGMERAYGSYEELLADSDIEAIYNPLPNHLHVDWTIKALEAGKHVLCEKPLGMDTADASRLLEVVAKYPELKVMEAFMYRFHPQWVAAKAWVDEGRIGELRTVHSFFSYNNVDPQNIRNRADVGGGGLLDIGCYCISVARFLFGERPKRVLGIVEKDANSRTDILSSGVLDFGSGTSTFTCSTKIFPYQRVQIIGTEGRIEIEIPFNPLPDEAMRIWLDDAKGVEERAFPVCDQYGLQGDLFSQAILDDDPVPTPLSDALDNMAVIDAIFKSGELSAWVGV